MPQDAMDSAQAHAPVPPAALRPVLARRALSGAMLLGLIADPLLRTGPWGLGLLVWMSAFAAVVIVVARQRGRRLTRESGVWLTVAVLCAAGLSWHDSDPLTAVDVLAMLTALVLLAMTLDGIPVASLAKARIRDLIRAAFGTGLDVATGTVPLVLRAAEASPAPAPSGRRSVRRLAKALAIAVPVVVVFTLLLRRADPVFESYFTFPNVDVNAVLSHVLTIAFFAWIAAGWMRRSLVANGNAENTANPAFGFTLGPLDVGLVFGALNVLFAAFVVVQIDWLFGGQALVLRTTGLSYAEYARRGFAELTGVAALLLPVLLGARALIPDADGHTLRWYRRLALPLVGLLGAIMVSAGARMQLYVRYYGISSARLYASAFMIWLAIVFAWLALTVLRARPRTFALGMVASGFAVLFALNVMNPDALVARANLGRGSGAGTGAAGADPRYVASLGGDAVPPLVSALTTPEVAAGLGVQADRCAAAQALLTRWTGARRERMAHGWTQWNLARSRAIRAVEAHEADLRLLACAGASAKP